MKKILIIILSLICFNLFGCSVATTTNNDNNKKGGSIDTTTTTEEESKVYDLIKDLNKYDLKEGDVFYNESLMYYISDKKTGDVIESYKIFYRAKNYRLDHTNCTIYSIYKYNSELKEYIFNDEFYYYVTFNNYGTQMVNNYTVVNKDSNKYSTCLDIKNKYEQYDVNKLLIDRLNGGLALMKIIIFDSFETILYINSELKSNTNYEFFTIEETKDKIIVRYKELNNRLVYKEYDINDYYLDIVHNIDDEPYIYLSW